MTSKVIRELIDLSYPVKNFNSIKEIPVVSMFSDNLQYNVIKPRTIVDNVSGDKKTDPK